MAARKPFLQTATNGEETERKLKEAVAAGVSDEQLAEQRISFAYGNASAGSVSTKDSVREASKHNRLVPA